MEKEQAVAAEKTGPLQKRVSTLIKAQMQKRDIERALTNCTVCGTHLFSTKSREPGDSAFTCSSRCTRKLADALKQLGKRDISDLMNEAEEFGEKIEALEQKLEQAKRGGRAIDYCVGCGIFLGNHPREEGDSAFTCSSPCTRKLADVLKGLTKENISFFQEKIEELEETLKKTREAIKPIIDNCLVCDDDLFDLTQEEEYDEVPKDGSSPITCSKNCTETMRRVVEEYKETLVAMLKQNGHTPEDEDIEGESLKNLLELAEEPNEKKE